MVIFLWKGTHYTKHRHSHKEEIINMIHGKTLGCTSLNGNNIVSVVSKEEYEIETL